MFQPDVIPLGDLTFVCAPSCILMSTDKPPRMMMSRLARTRRELVLYRLLMVGCRFLLASDLDKDTHTMLRPTNTADPHDFFFESSSITVTVRFNLT